VALAGILPVIRYAHTCRFNTLGAILIAPASVRFCSHACFWCDFDCTRECAILIALYVLVGLTMISAGLRPPLVKGPLQPPRSSRDKHSMLPLQVPPRPSGLPRFNIL
jgi:hypothetical protein